MSLPKVLAQTYELTIPSSGENVTYRPFLVKEEKVLLMAMESKDASAMSKAMGNIISACTEGDVNPKDLAPYDIEYFFLQLRGKSVGEVLDLKIPRPPNFTSCCKEAIEEDICEMTLNIDDISVDTSKIKKAEIEVSDKIGVKMKFPEMDAIQKYAGVEGEMSADGIFKLIIECIDYIWDGDEIYKAKDHTKKELNDFVESLSSKQFNGIREFFESMPRLTHDIEWTCPKCEKSNTLTLTGVEAFFG